MKENKKLKKKPVLSPSHSKKQLTSQTSTNDEQVEFPVLEWAQGWVERSGRGKIIKKEDTLSFESLSLTQNFICTCENSATTSCVAMASYDLRLQAKCINQKNNLSQQFFIILDYKKNGYLLLSLNISQKYVKLEKMSSNESIKLYGQISFKKFKPGKFNDIIIEVRGSKFSLFCDNIEVMRDVSPNDNNELLDGKIGVGTNCKLLLKNWNIRYIDLKAERPLPSDINREYADIIKSDIIQHDINVNWDDIAELGNAKKFVFNT